MVRRVRELGRSTARAAEAAGVSVRTVRKWLARHRCEGAAGLLAIVGTGVIVLVYGPLTSARVGEATQTVAPAAGLAPPADIGRR